MTNVRCVPCWWVGWWLWRVGCITQDTYLLYIYIHSVLIKTGRQVANKQKKDLEEARKKADDEEEHWENFSSWNFGIFTLFSP